MYALEQLQQKSLNELKEIGWELNVLPKGDRRRCQSWIDAIAGVNPPLLQLLEVSPAVSVEQVQGPIIETVESSPAVSVEPAQEPPIESKFGRIVYPRPAQGALEQAAQISPGVEVDRAQERIEEMFHISELQKLDEPHCPACGGIYSLEANWSKEYAFGFWIISCLKCNASCTCSIEELPRCFRDEDDDDDDDDNDDAKSENSLGVEVDRGREPVMETVESSLAAPKFQVGDLVKSKTMLWGLERKSMTGTVLELLPRGGVRVQFGDHISGYGGSFDFSKSGREDLIPVQEPIKPIDDFVNTSQRQEPIKPIDDFVNTSQRQEAIVSVAENSPGVEVDRVEDFLPECSDCFGDGYIEEEFGFIKFCQCETEPKLSHQKTQSAIAL